MFAGSSASPYFSDSPVEDALRRPDMPRGHFTAALGQISLGWCCGRRRPRVPMADVWRLPVHSMQCSWREDAQRGIACTTALRGLRATVEGLFGVFGGLFASTPCRVRLRWPQEPGRSSTCSASAWGVFRGLSKKNIHVSVILRWPLLPLSPLPPLPSCSATPQIPPYPPNSSSLLFDSCLLVLCVSTSMRISRHQLCPLIESAPSL